jgi:uncharacterized repeat protein (TIGR01451 family)
VKRIQRIVLGCLAAFALSQFSPASAAGGSNPQPDLIGSITATPAIVQPGATSQWSVAVTNTGDLAAGAFEVLIPGYGGVGATGTGWSCFSFAQSRSRPARTACQSAGLAAGESATITIPVIASGSAGTYSLTATVDSTTSVAESNETNNAAAGSYVVPVNGPFDFVANHTVLTPANLVLPSETVTFNTEVVNNGLYRGFTTQRITDTLPIGFSFVSFSAFVTPWDPTLGTPVETVSCSPTGVPETGVVVTCTGVPNSSYATTGGGIVSIVAQAPAAIDLVDYTVSDSVVVDSNSAFIESNETNNTAASAVHVTNKLPDLALQLSTQNPVTAGGIITHSVTISNNGTGVAPTAQMRFTSLAGTWIGGGDAAVTCGTLFTTRSGATRGCTTSDLAAGASVTFPVQLQASGVAGTTTTSGNAYVVGSREVPVGPDNFASTTATVAVGGAVDLSVTASATPATAAVGQPFSLTLAVRNSGIGAASATMVQTTLPVGFVFASGSTIAGSCAAAVQVITCPIATTGPGTSQVYAIELVAPKAAGTFAAVSVVDPDNLAAETDETNNKVSTQIVVSNAFADLIASVSGPTTTPVNGKPVFSVSVSNVGSVAVAAPTVTVSESGFDRIDSIVAPAGWLCSTTRIKNAGNILSCVGGPLAAGSTATISVTTAGAYVRGATAMTANADPANAVQELAETNNASSFTITVI